MAVLWPAGEGGIITVSPGGYIDDAAAKQQVLNWTTYGYCALINNEDKATIVKSSTPSSGGLPDILDITKLDGKAASLQRQEFIVGVALPESNVDGYIKHFYSDFTAIPNLGKKLVESRLLRAQLSFCQGGSGTAMDVRVVDFCQSGSVDTCQIDTNLIACTALKSNFDITVYDTKEQEYKVDGSTLKGAVLSDYNISNASIKGFTVDAMKKLCGDKMEGEQAFKRLQAGSSYGTTLRMRLYVEKDDLPALNSAGLNVPDGMVGKPTPYYAEVRSSAGTAGSLAMAELSSLAFQQLLPKYANAEPAITGTTANWSFHRDWRNTPSEGVPVEVPWPCYIVKSNDCVGYRGIPELASGNGISNKLLGRLYSTEEYAAIWQRYQAEGPVKVLFHPNVADMVRATFIDLANFYGKDIIIVCPAFCAFGSIRGTHNKHTSSGGISAHWARCAVDFDYNHEGVTKNLARTEMGKYKDTAYRGAMKIFKAHGGRWGRSQPDVL